MTVSLKSVFHPSTVAVLGASADPRKIGGRVMNHLLDNRYPGTVYPISLSTADISGIKCLSSIAHASAPVDIAFLAIPASATLAAVQDCAAAGVGAVIIGSSGYAESGEQGKALQEELAHLAKATGIRLIGPNCNGIYSAHAGLSLGFNSGHGLAIPAGDVAIISHSGALFDVFARRLIQYGAGLSFFVSAGNEVDLGMHDYLDYAIEDPNTRVIALVLDGIGDGQRFRQQARRAHAADKSIVALKIGLSSRGEAAAVAHSSRMASGAQVYRSFLQACGIPLVETPEGLLAAAAFLSRHGKGSGAAVVLSTSGAGGAIMADLGERHGVALADFGEHTHARLADHRQFSTISNPIDIGVFGTLDHFDQIIDAVTDDAAVGMTIGLFPTLPPATHASVVQALGAAQTRTGKANVLLLPGGLSDAAAELCKTHGITCFTETVACLEAAQAYLAPVASTDPFAHPIATLKLPGSGPLDEAASLALLARHGVPVVPAQVCRDADSAEHAARNIGFPVVIKGIAEGVAHKSDLGLVKLNVADTAAVRETYEALGCHAVLVQPMLKGELEVIVGYSHCNDAGGMLIAGLGGIHAEAIQDTVMWAVPATRHAVEATLSRSTIGRILSSSRWRHPQALPALVDALLGVQALAMAGTDRVVGIDVNPLLLGAHGAVAVDGLVVLSDPVTPTSATSLPVPT